MNTETITEHPAYKCSAVKLTIRTNVGNEMNKSRREHLNDSSHKQALFSAQYSTSIMILISRNLAQWKGWGELGSKQLSFIEYMRDYNRAVFQSLILLSAYRWLLVFFNYQRRCELPSVVMLVADVLVPNSQQSITTCRCTHLTIRLCAMFQSFSKSGLESNAYLYFIMFKQRN